MPNGPPPECGFTTNISPVDLTKPVDAGAGSPSSPPPPAGKVSRVAFSVDPPLQNAERVVAGLMARTRACYRRSLATDPKMKGDLTLVVLISPNGEVTGAKTSGRTTLDAAVVSCVERTFRMPTFDAPGGKGATITVKHTFTP